LARIRELHALNPDKARTRRHKWEQRNPDKIKAYTAKQTAKQKAKLDEAERVKNLEALDVNVKTGLRISLAACLSLQGAKPYVMRNEIFPDGSKPLDNIKKLFSKYELTLEAEKNRLRKYSEDERRAQGERLRVRLRRKLNLEN
jgi:hypothetical protein